MSRYVWGVDSAQSVNDSLYNCVIRNFNYPNYWGRYLSTVQGAADGLTRAEVQFLKEKGVKILPIYNNFREAVGYSKGKVVAQNAVYWARRLQVAEGTVIFANVERFFKVDEAWIRGWVDGMEKTGYRIGIYHDPIEGEFNQAFCQAVVNNRKVRTHTILWSAEPEKGVTKSINRPRYNPAAPDCDSNVWGWQYGRDSQVCPIDTNLIEQRLFNLLW